jgi:hypothetical protein
MRFVRALAPWRGRVEAWLDVDRFLDASNDPALVRFDQYALAERRRRQAPEALIVEESLTNLVWGRRRQRPGGEAVLALEGCELNKPWLLGPMFEAIGRTHGVSAIEIVCSEDSPLARAMRRTSPSEPSRWFCWKRLSGDGEIRFDAYLGMEAEA